MRSKNIWETAAGAIIGFQAPLNIDMKNDKDKKLQDKKEKFKKSCSQKEIEDDICEQFLSEVKDEEIEDIDIDETTENIAKELARPFVKKAVDEFVKKSPDGGYVLYKPHRVKGEPAKKVGQFASKLAAKRVELAKFPPKSARSLYRLRKEIERLSGVDSKKKKNKSGKKKSEKPIVQRPPEFVGDKEFFYGKDTAKESILRAIISPLINESLFNEEVKESEWQEYIRKIPQAAVDNDKKFKKYQEQITRKTKEIFSDAFNSIKKNVGKGVACELLGIKQSDEKMYAMFSVEVDNVTIQPLYIYLEAGIPKIEIPDIAKASMTKADADTVKLLRADLISVQERILDRMNDVISLYDSRDNYLKKLQDEIDSFVIELSPLQVSLLKQLIIKKYRKI